MSAVPRPAHHGCMRRTNPIVLLAGLSVSVVRQVFERRVGAAFALLALCLTMQAGTAGAARVR